MKKILTTQMTRFDIHTREDIIRLLDMKVDTFNKYLRLVPLSYKNILIPKKDGGERMISVPVDNLKKVQRVILDKILSKIHLPHCVYGFSREKTIINNAKYHANSDNLLKLDIQNFFPNIHFEKVRQMFKDIGFNESVSEILCQISTFEYRLPQGAPTSPFIASLALNNLDYRLLNLAHTNHISYSRYFDDLCFSGGKRVFILEKDIIQIIIQEGYKIQRRKRKLFTKGEVKEINGILISNGVLFLKKTSDLFLYLNELKKYGYKRLRSDNPEKERASLIGKISFLTTIDPKNGAAAEKIMKSIRW